MFDRRWMAAAAALGLAACGPQPAEKHPPPASSASPGKPMSEGERALRAARGSYYFDFIKQPAFGRFAPDQLGLSRAREKRFSRVMEVAIPAVLAGGALVHAGCAAHECGDTAGVLAIDVATGEVFAGVSDEAGAAVFIPNQRLQKLLESASPSHQWTDPPRR